MTLEQFQKRYHEYRTNDPLAAAQEAMKLSVPGYEIVVIDCRPYGFGLALGSDFLASVVPTYKPMEILAASVLGVDLFTTDATKEGA